MRCVTLMTRSRRNSVTLMLKLGTRQNFKQLPPSSTNELLRTVFGERSICGHCFSLFLSSAVKRCHYGCRSHCNFGAISAVMLSAVNFALGTIFDSRDVC